MSFSKLFFPPRSQALEGKTVTPTHAGAPHLVSEQKKKKNMHPVSCPTGTALDVKEGGPQHLYTYKSQLFYTKNKNHPAQFNAGLDGTVAHIMRNER